MNFSNVMSGMILMHWKCIWMFCMNWCYIIIFFQCIWIILGKI